MEGLGEQDRHHQHDGTAATLVIGGGMSRAAKKRAKKKKKEINGGVTTAARGGDDDNYHHVAEETSVKKKRKKQTIENGKHDRNDNDDNDDANHNEIGMKPSGGADVKSTSLKSCPKRTAHDNNNNSIDTLPLDGLTSLVKDILLVDDDDSNSDTNDAATTTITKSPPLSSSSPLSNKTARERARMTLAFLLAPAAISVEEFYQDYWEKKPLHVKCKQQSGSSVKKVQHQHRHRLDGLLSLQSIKKTLCETPLYLGKDLNVTRYHEMEDGVKRRQTLDRTLVAAEAAKNDKNVQTNKSKTNNNKGDDDDKNGDEDDDNVSCQLADPNLVWKHYEQGCSIRLLCPHDAHFSNNIHALLSLLELEFGCMVGANAYLTPPCAAQGFAPHYDDIEAFCLQLQGHKRWKVYEPWNKAERLPRVSSGDFTEQDLLKHNANMVMDIVLSPGDLLYMPRGWIHQACTLPSSSSSSSSSKSSDHKKRKRNKDDDDDNTDDQHQHSLHLTVSAMQHWSWVDLMEVLLPQALEAAANSETSIALRQGLPRQFLSYMGAIYDGGDCPEPLRLLRNRLEGQEAEETAATADDGNTPNASTTTTAAVAGVMEQLQQDFRSEAKKRIMRVAKEAMDMIDASCDQMAKQFLSSCQPPALTQRELQATSRRLRKESDKEEDNDKGENDHQLRLRADDQVRLVRPGVARLVVEDGMAVLYHCLDNSRVYHATPLSPMEFEMDDAAAMEQLLLATEPNWILIADLFHDSIQDKVGVAQSLYDEGILVLRRQYEEEQADEENTDAQL